MSEENDFDANVQYHVVNANTIQTYVTGENPDAELCVLPVNAAAQALACRLIERGVANVALYDVSATHPSVIVAEAFRCSHLVFAATTYNAGIFCNMETALNDLRAHNLQNRAVALIENGSWAPASGSLMRELIGGIYFGERGRTSGPDGEAAFDTERYSRSEIERIAHAAFAVAQKRGRRVTSVDKANVLESSRLWRETVHAVAAQYPDVALSDMFVDNAAMQLVRAPGQFDVIVTSNMFGDILSDEASQLTGSIGMLPSASLGATARGMYEPIHGSAPDIAGTGKANPIATILSAAMLLRYSLAEADAADAIERAVSRALDDGLRTADIAAPGAPALTTAAMTDAIVERL